MNALVLQCGGPTAVVNASLAAVVRRWRATFPLDELQGGRCGLAALLTGDWIPAASLDDDWISAAERAPGMALGGGRDRLGVEDLDRALVLLTSRGIRVLFLIGGNGTMAAGRVLATRARQAGLALRIAGIPKTIDNDIPCTDICPGFASAARFLIESVRDVAADISSMGRYEDVVLIEAMGRHSGWLTAATLLARPQPSGAPHLVFVPEQPLSTSAFLSAVRDQHARAGLCIAVVSEGLRDEAGKFFAALGADLDVERDASGQVILGRSGGPLPYLARLVRTQLRLRCRSVRPDVLQRCSRAHVVPWDRHIAALAGEAAVAWAAGAEGADAVMIALRRLGDGWGTEPVPLDDVAGERTLPADLHSDAAALKLLLT